MKFVICSTDSVGLQGVSNSGEMLDSRHIYLNGEEINESHLLFTVFYRTGLEFPFPVILHNLAKMKELFLRLSSASECLGCICLHAGQNGQVACFTRITISIKESSVPLSQYWIDSTGGFLH